MKIAKVLTAQDFVHSDLKNCGEFTLLVVHTNLAGTASRPDEYHDDEARAFLAAVTEVAEEFPEVQVALLDSRAYPEPARLLTACVDTCSECEALVFIGSSYIRHRTVYYEDATKESLRSWLLGLLLQHGFRIPRSREDAMILLAFDLAEPPKVDFGNEARWSDVSIRDRAIQAVTASVKALQREWHPFLFAEEEFPGDDEDE
jgi:hypothetical protein